MHKFGVTISPRHPLLQCKNLSRNVSLSYCHQSDTLWEIFEEERVVRYASYKVFRTTLSVISPGIFFESHKPSSDPDFHQAAGRELMVLHKALKIYSQT